MMQAPNLAAAQATDLAKERAELQPTVDIFIEEMNQLILKSPFNSEWELELPFFGGGSSKDKLVGEMAVEIYSSSPDYTVEIANVPARMAGAKFLDRIPESFKLVVRPRDHKTRDSDSSK